MGGVKSSTPMARTKRIGPPGRTPEVACFRALFQLNALSRKLNGKIQTIKIRASTGNASLISQSIVSPPLDRFAKIQSLGEVGGDHNPYDTVPSGNGTPALTKASRWRRATSAI